MSSTGLERKSLSLEQNKERDIAEQNGLRQGPAAAVVVVKCYFPHERVWPNVSGGDSPLLRDLETEASRGSLTPQSNTGEEKGRDLDGFQKFLSSPGLLIPSDPHLPHLPDSGLGASLIPPSPSSTTSHQVPSALSSQNLPQLPPSQAHSG